LFGENKKLFYENKPIIESFLSKNNFKYSKGVKSIIKFKYYNYELLNGNKAPVIANVNKKKEYSIGQLTLKFIIICLFI